MTFSIHHVPNSFDKLHEMVGADAFDVTITDPPYSDHCQSNMCSGSLVGTSNVPKYTLEFSPLTEYSWLKRLIQVTRRWVVVFCTFEDFGRFEMAVGRENYVRSCVWYKTNAMGQLTRDRPASAYEGIALIHAPQVKKNWNGAGSYGVWQCPENLQTFWSCAGTRGLHHRHPNEKPIELCMKLTALFSNRGELVFDPFCGSSAIGEAALRLGRRYEGWDKSKLWVNKSRSRLEDLTVDTTDEAALKMCTMRDAA